MSVSNKGPGPMARAKLKFLSNDEIERIHSTSVRILEDVGVRIYSGSAASMLVDSGARIDKGNKRVLIGEDLVKSALKSAPRSFTLAAMDRKWDLKLPSDDRIYVTNGGEGAFVKDLITGESRYSTTEDVLNFTVLTQTMPQIDFWWQMVGANDLPEERKYLTELTIAFENTNKHVQSMAGSAEEARISVEMASALAGGRDALAKRPIMSVVPCPISPLTFEEGLVEAQIEFSRASIPVVAMVASVAGLTSPVTLSGMIAQVNAENLASLVISQVAKRGSPWIYSSDSSSGDLKMGSVNYGTFETIISRAGSAQMARHYNMPSMLAGLSLERVSQSITDLEEGVPYLVIQSMIDTDLGSGFGGADQAIAASYEQFIIDSWVWELARGFGRRFDADDAAISFQTLRSAALDGNFLNKRHTITRFRDESFAISHPKAVLSGLQTDGPRGALIRKAREEADRILRLPRKPLLEKDEAERIERIAKGRA